MKSKLFISGVLISISCLTFSCTNDDYETQPNNHGELKIAPKYLLNNNEEANIGSVQDSIVQNVIHESNIQTNTDGDPSNPRPPRKD
ncbi:MAG: hypothetical protein ABI850_06805 [Flavobacterium sp.]